MVWFWGRLFAFRYCFRTLHVQPKDILPSPAIKNFEPTCFGKFTHERLFHPTQGTQHFIWAIFRLSVCFWELSQNDVSCSGSVSHPERFFTPAPRCVFFSARSLARGWMGRSALKAPNALARTRSCCCQASSPPPRRLRRSFAIQLLSDGRRGSDPRGRGEGVGFGFRLHLLPIPQ